ncbi:hypothetical protein [Pseudoruegeria sp. SK021]|uniref:hypothetical protein n=1 Tax=Pseudoruegeria sp. SK021 TaxID=1933035 RepID=UPI000A22FE7A|nr:hypothetical protein [Pseudoruegeria sp. SK021]OSP53820.1 hypothetical protein BV911_15755 [Pseudoruegeria sp. SK021]
MGFFFQSHQSAENLKGTGQTKSAPAKWLATGAFTDDLNGGRTVDWTFPFALPKNPGDMAQ